MEARGRDSYNTGDRMSTLMLYLTEVTAGGYTAFPRLGVAVRSDRKIIVKLRQGSGKDRQGMALKAKGLKA